MIAMNIDLQYKFCATKRFSVSYTNIILPNKCDSRQNVGFAGDEKNFICLELPCINKSRIHKKVFGGRFR